MDKPGIVRKLHKLPSVGVHKKIAQSGNLITGLGFLLAWVVVFLCSTYHHP